MNEMEHSKPVTPEIVADAFDLVRAYLRGDDLEQKRSAFIAKYPDFEPLVPPRMKYHAQIMLRGDSRSELEGELKHVLSWMRAGHHVCLSGRSSLKIIVDDSMTPEKFRAAEDEYLKKMEAAHAAIDQCF